MALAIDLSGKVILICGAGRGGISGATARAAASAGATIVALDREQDLLDELREDVEALGGTVHTLLADLSDVAQCEGVVGRVIKACVAGDANAHNALIGMPSRNTQPLSANP